MTNPLSYNEAIGNPGKYPFTRGIHPEMYHARLWTMRQYAGYGDAEDTNTRFKLLLQQGQTGLSTAFDLPTQMGYDPDDPKALGEVGRVGVNIASVDDMARLFSGISLERVSTSMTINATAAILLALYIAEGSAHGVSEGNLSGTVQNDVLKEYIARGTYIYPLSFSMRLATDIIEYCVKKMPKMNPISVSGYHMREAGATAVQEIAFTFANALVYLEESRKRALSPGEIAARLSFFFAATNDFFEEIAKFRAARRLWSMILKQTYGVTDPKAQMLRFHTQTAGSTLTSQQPINNVVRVAFQALAAVFGGTQSLHTNAYDEALALPTEASAALALRTQQILAHETKVTQVADPVGGSHHVESLTQKLFEEAQELLREIKERGGALACIESGYFSEAIQQSAYEAQQKIEKKESLVVGVNAFVSESEEIPAVLKIDPKTEEDAVRRIQKLRAARSPSEAKAKLETIARMAESNENLIPFLVDAVKARCTLGEICSALRKLYGEYDSPG